MEPPPKAYGEGRIRANVSYGAVERAAIAILKSERRPTVEAVREALAVAPPTPSVMRCGGSGETWARAWKATRLLLTRMPPDITDLADGMWQRALKLAGEAAKNDDNFRARAVSPRSNSRTRSKNNRSSFAKRKLDAQALGSARRALADSREHLLLLMKTLARDQAQLRASEDRVAELETQGRATSPATGRSHRQRGGPESCPQTPADRSRRVTGG